MSAVQDPIYIQALVLWHREVQLIGTFSGIFLFLEFTHMEFKEYMNFLARLEALHSGALSTPNP